MLQVVCRPRCRYCICYLVCILARLRRRGPVNGDECYFWRTTGCHFGDKCHYKHIPEQRGKDRKPWQPWDQALLYLRVHWKPGHTDLAKGTNTYWTRLSLLKWLRLAEWTRTVKQRIQLVIRQKWIQPHLTGLQQASQPVKQSALTSSPLDFPWIKKEGKLDWLSGEKVESLFLTGLRK